MGSRGPLPKGRRSRARDERRAAAAAGIVALPAAGREGPVPRLPGASRLTATARRWWRDAWTSPPAVMWDETADLPAVVRLAHLWDRALRGEATASEAGEARQLEDRLGLTPAARRRLGWTIVDDDADELGAAAAGAADGGEAADGGDDLGARIVELRQRLEGGAS